MLRAGGGGLDALAKKFGVSKDSIHRHWHLHVPSEIKSAYLAGPGDLASFVEKAAKEGDSILDYLRLCRGVLTAQIAATTEAGDARAAAYVADKLRLLLETIAKVTGELGNLASVTINNTTNVAVLSEHPAFLRLQATILRSLAKHPEARAAVVAALRQLDHENAQAALPAPAKPDMVVDHAA
ncbi:MAG: hypothetical protein WBA66_02790 [Xanthobacteraceae bacterium]